MKSRDKVILKLSFNHLSFDSSVVNDADVVYGCDDIEVTDDSANFDNFESDTDVL